METITSTMIPIIDAIEPTPGMRHVPKQQRSRDTLRDILAAAQLVIETRGIERFTTGDIARAADLPIGTVYRYFADRVAILDHLHPNRHTALADANDRIAAIAAYLEEARTYVITGQGMSSWTATDRLTFLDGALTILAGSEDDDE